MTDKDIQQLIDRYLEGETSPAEERHLALALNQREKLSDDWQAIRLMLGELTLGEAEYDSILHWGYTPGNPDVLYGKTKGSVSYLSTIKTEDL